MRTRSIRRSKSLSAAGLPALAEQLERRQLLSAEVVRDEFTVGVYMAVTTTDSLTQVSLASGALRTYAMAPWSQEFTFTVGSGAGAQNVLAFYDGAGGGSVTTIDLNTETQSTYSNIGGASQTWSSGTILALYSSGTLTTIDVGTGFTQTVSIGNFSQEFTVSIPASASTGTPAQNVFAFYNNAGQASGNLTVVNASNDADAHYGVGTFTQEFTLGSVLSFYNQGTLTTQDVITGASSSYNVGVFSQEFTLSTPNVLAFYAQPTLTLVNVASQTRQQYNLTRFTSEWTLSNYLAFYSPDNGGTVTILNAANLDQTPPEQSEIVGNWTQEWTLGNVLAFYNNGLLTTLDAGTAQTGDQPVPISIGIFTQEFTLSSAGGTAATVAPNVLAFYHASTLLALNVLSKAEGSYDVGTFSQEWTVTIGTGATATNVMSFYSAQGGGVLTAVNLSQLGTINQPAPSEIIGNWTQEWSVGSILTFYQGGNLLAVDAGTITTGTSPTTYSVGSFNSEFTLMPATVPQGLLAFYNGKQQTITLANLSSGSAEPFPITLPVWTEEWTGSSNASVTNAAAAVGTNVLTFYNEGNLTAFDLAAGTVILSAAAPSPTGESSATLDSPVVPVHDTITSPLPTVISAPISSIAGTTGQLPSSALTASSANELKISLLSQLATVRQNCSEMQATLQAPPLTKPLREIGLLARLRHEIAQFELSVAGFLALKSPADYSARFAHRQSLKARSLIKVIEAERNGAQQVMARLPGSETTALTAGGSVTNSIATAAIFSNACLQSEYALSAFTATSPAHATN